MGRPYPANDAVEHRRHQEKEAKDAWPRRTTRTALVVGLDSSSVGHLPSEPAHEESRMSGSSDETKGRVKQAVGDLTGDKALKREGKVDELAGKAKKFVDSLKDRLTKNR
jgi:uncharacterized protein YjbJ (UPF0337 family)